MSGSDEPKSATEETTADVDSSPTGPEEQETEATGFRARLSVSDRGVLVKASPAVLLLVILLAILVTRARRSSS